MPWSPPPPRRWIHLDGSRTATPHGVASQGVPWRKMTHLWVRQVLISWAPMNLRMVLVIGLAACGGGGGAHHLADAPQARLVLDPPDLTVTIVNDQVMTRAYTAHLQDDTGQDVDVTAETTFTLHDAGYGSFAGAMLTVSGGGAGPTRVEATARGVSGDAGLLVYVKKTVVSPSGPPDAPTLFKDATEDPTLAPAIAYPLDGILVPPNLGQFDVHWKNNAGAGAANNLFEVTMSNQYIDVRLYSTGLEQNAGQPYWTVFQPQAWYPIASTRQQLSLSVAGLNTAAPTKKGTAAAQHVDVTNENTKGGIYYWTTSNGATVYRYDVGHPETAPAPFFGGTVAAPASCIGCHVLSRDGTKMAMTLTGGGGAGMVYNVGDRTRIGTAALNWDFAAFDATSTKLVTVEGSQLYLRTLTGDKLAGPLPPVTTSALQTHPELSPDNTKLVSVEFSGGGYAAQAYSGSIVIRSFDAVANTFGTPTVLVPYAAGAANWYPSFSPDGKWVVFTRTGSYSYDSGDAQTWIVKADGSAPPVQLATANLTGSLTNSWARWVPFGQTFGAANEPIYYLTFSSRRAFGVRIPGGGRPQIWMTPVFPTRAAAGQDPAGKAFRVPFQDVNTSNHIAQWTQAVVSQ